MSQNSKIVLVAAVMLGAASASLADSVRLPNLDLHKLCERNDASVRDVITDVSQNSVSTCVADEQGAREQILKEWATYPAVAKSRCVHPKEYLPGYVEWVACLEMTRDLIKQRKDAAPAPAVSDAGRSCPIVRTDQDGSIRSVIACRLQ
jgi:hypothetical protein